jgi:hypothetical protein
MPNPDRDWHFEEYPKKTSFEMAFVALVKARPDAERGFDLTITIRAVSNSRQ